MAYGESQNGSAAYRCTGTTGLVVTAAVVTRHTEGVVFSFVDGHAKWYKTNPSGTRGIIYRSASPFSESGNAPTFRVTE